MPKSGGTFTGTVSHGDNVKAQFGNSDDLQIYHDGSNSYIVDNGTGDLVINTNGNAISLNTNGGGEYGLRVINNGAVNLYYDNAIKLATTAYGIAVTGNAICATETASKTGSVTPDLASYQNFVWTLTGNITLANPTTEVVGMSGVFVFIHSGAGRTVSLGTDWETAGAAGLTLSGASGAVDIVPYFVQSTGNILLGTPMLAFS